MTLTKVHVPSPLPAGTTGRLRCCRRSRRRRSCSELRRPADRDGGGAEPAVGVARVRVVACVGVGVARRTTTALLCAPNLTLTKLVPLFLGCLDVHTTLLFQILPHLDCACAFQLPHRLLGFVSVCSRNRAATIYALLESRHQTECPNDASTFSDSTRVARFRPI